MRLATPKEVKKAEERRLLEQVSFARGTPLVKEAADHDPDAFPDGHFQETDKTRTGVEAVEAFEVEPNERIGSGSRNMVALKKAAEMASQIADPESGIFAAFGAHGGEPYAIPLDGTRLIPPRLQPEEPDKWLIAAIDEKLRHYGRSGVSTRDIVLAIRFHWPHDLNRQQIDRIARWLRDRGAPFREVWVANDYGTPPQRVS